ncbi:exocyst complex component 6B-like isoform X6 [Clavelina lepadiformis]|uniref:exocyst complex component 6B-like isoform X6 n=1 Tax=Clavelina lepadiformis TaxID=159417 RepID=UPI00404308B0
MESIKEEQAGQGLNPFQEKSSSDLKTAESTTSAATRKEKKENGNAKNGDKDSLQNQITPKRRRSMTVKLMRRVSTSAIMKSPSSLTNEGDDNSGGDVADGRKSKDKNKVPVVDVTITTPDNDTPTSTSQPMSTPKRNFFRTMSQSAIKRGNQEKRKSKRLNSNVDQISPSKISVPPPQVDQPEESIEPDYSDVVEEIRKTPKNTKLSAPSRPQMDIEYGKADIDTREYAHDIIIQEIERGFFLGPALRAVYEGNDHEKFLERLDCRIKQHDRDIERMCNFHYQGFIESITELINVRSDAEKLKSQTLVINKELQESGKEVARKSDDLIQCQLQQRNVASAIEKLSECLPVLQMYAKMMEQMRAGRYYSALKTLEQLEHTALPSVYRYRFCEIMLENIPKIREEIKGVSMSELKDFLEKVRQNSDKIGMVAMKQVEKERNLEQSAVSGDRSDSFGVKSSSEEESPAEADLPRIRAKPINKNSKIPSKTRTNVRAEALNSNHSASPQHRQRLNPFDEIEDEVEEVMDSRNPFDDPNPFTQEPSKSKVTENGLANPFLDENEDVVKTHDVNPFFDTDNAFKEPTTPDALKDMNYEDLSASDLVDFSPVYKCLHIFGLVGSQTQFENYYRTQRRNQARLVLQPSVSMQDNPDAYRNFFHQIVGFFVVEDHVLHTAPNLISRQWINDLWEMAISKLIAGLRTDSGYCSDAVVMMKVKNLIVIFADTLKAYGFSVGRLFSLLMEMRDQYGEILLKHWAQKFNDIFNEDNYTPMLIESDMETQALLNIFPHEDPNFDQAKYPRKLPFSKFVPRIYNEIKNFILACLKYCEDLHLSSTEVDDMIRKSANLLLTRTLASGLQLLVAKRSLGLAELVQIIVNTTYLENSCRYIEDFVQSITGVRAGSAHSAKLVGVSTFKDARNETETQIYNKLNSKIDEFFELAEYAWDVKEPKGMASRYLLDLIAFLRHNFEVFTNLPPKVAQTACMSACQHISARMMELVMDPDVKTVTLAALQQFSLDVMQCELFSNSDPVPGFQDGALQMTFVEIRQLLDLFLSWDWSSYLADYGNGNSKYLRVNPGTALTLLEKIKEERGHRNIFTSLSKQEREKKKLLETVVRQLRGIVNDWTILCVPRGKLSPQKQRKLLM